MAPAWNTIKRPTTSSFSTTRFQHCITIVDLTSFGIANTLGIGLHVLLGHAAHDSAGPSVVLSYILLSVAALLSGLCIGELAEQFPDITGWSSYAYTYAVVGKLFAFLFGWNVVLELAIGSAVAAKAWIQYADLAVFNGTGVTNNPFFVFGVSSRFQSGDVAAFLLLLVIGIFTAMYVKVVCIVNNVFVVVCVLFVGGTVFVGLFNVDPKNWTSGTGFFPNGMDGILGAVSMSAFSFVGVELMTAMSAETMDSTSFARLYSTSVGCVFVLGLLVCFAFAVVLTLVVPYTMLSDSASVARIFVTRGVASMSGFVFVGATCGLLASMLTSSVVQSRVLHALARDGLLPRRLTNSLRQIHLQRGTPLQSTLVCSVASALLALLLDIRSLLAMLGVGTLLGMAAAPILVLINRYKESGWNEVTCEETSMPSATFSTSRERDPSTSTYGSTVEQPLHDLAVELVDDQSFRTYALEHSIHQAIVDDDDAAADRLPCIPWLPLICMLMHVVFMICLPLVAWIRFLVWSTLGLIVYATNQKISCGDRDIESVINTGDQDHDNWLRPVLPIGDRRRRNSTEVK